MKHYFSEGQNVKNSVVYFLKYLNDFTILKFDWAIILKLHWVIPPH